MPENLKPAALKPGDTIGVMAPSSYAEKKSVLAARDFLQGKGFNVLLHPQYETRHNQSAGTHAEKLAALYDLFKNPDVKAIIAARGGNRALHLLERLDFSVIAENPKIFMGFSDVTALLNAFYCKTGLVTFHGPVLTWLSKPGMYDFNMELLAGGTPEYPMEQCRVLRPGSAEGKLAGGNLSVFHLMPGTDFDPVCKGALLFLEDVSEEINNLDRMLLHLRRRGVFGKISGLICGGFTELKDSGTPYGFTLDDLVMEHTEGYDFPVVLDAPFGHGDQLYAFPLGIPARLVAKNNNVSLELMESAVTI